MERNKTTSASRVFLETITRAIKVMESYMASISTASAELNKLNARMYQNVEKLANSCHFYSTPMTLPDESDIMAYIEKSTRTAEAWYTACDEAATLWATTGFSYTIYSIKAGGFWDLLIARSDQVPTTTHNSIEIKVLAVYG